MLVQETTSAQLTTTDTINITKYDITMIVLIVQVEIPVGLFSSGQINK